MTLTVLICANRHRWWGGAMGKFAAGDQCPTTGCPHLLAVDPDSPHNRRSRELPPADSRAHEAALSGRTGEQS